MMPVAVESASHSSSTNSAPGCPANPEFPGNRKYLWVLDRSFVGDRLWARSREPLDHVQPVAKMRARRV